MDAKELTVKYHNLEGMVLMLQKEVDFLRSEYEKQRLIISDLQIDVKMLERKNSVQ